MIPSPFRQIQGQRIFEAILDQLEQAILDGHISAGDRLPPERELAAEFGASRTSVREAVRVLEALGVVKVRPGADNGAVLVEEPADALRLLLRFQLALRHVGIESVIEFRVVMEPWTAAAAAERADDDELEAIAARLEAMEEADGQAEFHRLDAAFHLEIARAAANDLAVLVLEGARTAIERIMLDALARVPDWPEARERILREHRAVVDAIRERRPEAAAALMEEHIGGFYASVGLQPRPHVSRHP